MVLQTQFFSGSFVEPLFYTFLENWLQIKGRRGWKYFFNLIIQYNLYFLSSMLASSALDEQNRFLHLVNDADYAELRTAEQMLYKNVDAYLLNSPEYAWV